MKVTLVLRQCSEQKAKENVALILGEQVHVVRVYQSKSDTIVKVAADRDEEVADLIGGLNTWMWAAETVEHTLGRRALRPGDLIWWNRR